MYHKRGFLIVFLLFSFFVTVFSQSGDSWYYDKEIKNIKLKGLQTINRIDLDAIISPFEGEKFTDLLYSDLLNKLYSLEYFEDIIPLVLPADENKTAIILEFSVTERPVIKKLQFIGNNQVRTGEIRDAIGIKENEIYVQSKLLLDERKIRDLYLQKGYTNINIDSSVTEDDRTVEILFKIDEGKATVIKAINFQGNNIVSAKTLKKDLTLKEIGLFQKGAFQEASLELDKQSILRLYNAKGYIDAKINSVLKDVTYNEAKNRDELTITYVVTEGEQYTFKDFQVEGNKVFSTDEIMNLLKLKNGAVFNQTRFQESLMAIYDLYYENGYTSNGFIPDIQRDPVNRVVSCVLTVTERPRSHVENIVIVGNEKTKPHVILREIPLSPGDIFSKKKMEIGLRGLYNLSYFTSLVPEIVQGSEENLIDIILNVEERSTISVEFGVTFSGISDPAAWPVSLFAKWADSNFLGSGKGISANIRGSNDEQSISFDYADTWFLGKPLMFSAGFFVSHKLGSSRYYDYSLPDPSQSQNYMNFNALSFGFNTSLGKRWVYNFAVLSVTGGLSNSFTRNFYDNTLYEPIDTIVEEKHGRFGIQNSIWAKAALDARDLIYDPSKGWFASQQFTWTGLLPKIEHEYFLSSDTKGEIYFTLLDKPVSETWNLKFVLAGYTGLSFLVPAKNYPLGMNNQLYINGMFNARGWDNVSMIRGKALWTSFIEFRMPIAPRIFSFDIFFDHAAISQDLKNLVSGLQLNDNYFSFGFGIRFSLPQFPLRLLWAWPFKYQNGNFMWGGQANQYGKFVLSFNLTNQ